MVSQVGERAGIRTRDPLIKSLGVNMIINDHRRSCQFFFLLLSLVYDLDPQILGTLGIIRDPKVASHMLPNRVFNAPHKTERQWP